MSLSLQSAGIKTDLLGYASQLLPPEDFGRGCGPLRGVGLAVVNKGDAAYGDAQRTEGPSPAQDV